MRVVVQRVKRASVTIGGELHSSIGRGLLILLGVEESDELSELEWLVKKCANLRIFDDENGVMNRSLLEVGRQVATGVFGADMQVELINDGPVTICMDTKNKE